MKFHQEGLKEKQIRVLQQAGKSLHKRGIYLGDGTALAIYYGHRVSLDLEWFLSTAMGNTLQLAESLRKEGLDFIITQTGPGTLYGTILGVRVSFLEYRYPMLGPLTFWKKMNCSLASLDDLACMKLSTIAQRGHRKDFCDIYFLGTKHRPLRDMLGLYRQKFRVQDINPILYGLSYFDDADSEPMPRMLLKIQWRTIKKTVQQWTKELGKI